VGRQPSSPQARHDAYDSREIEGAPRLGSADGLPTDQVQVLYDHYALGYDGPDQAPRATTVERVLMYLR
jgi:hypothetical protein